MPCRLFRKFTGSIASGPKQRIAENYRAEPSARHAPLCAPQDSIFLAIARRGAIGDRCTLSFSRRVKDIPAITSASESFAVLIHFTSCILVNQARISNLKSLYDPPGVRPHGHLCGLNAAKTMELDIAWVSTTLTVLAILRSYLEGRRPGIANSCRRWSRINQTAGWSTYSGAGTDANRPRVRIRSGCSALSRWAGRAGQAALVPRPAGVKSSRRMARKIRRPLQFDKFLEDKQMTKSTFSKLLFAVMVAIGFTGVPGNAFAQRGGGGFHGGSGGGGRPSGGPVRSSAAAARGRNFGARSGSSMSAGSPGSSAVSANRAISHIDNSHFGSTSHVSSSFSGSHTNTSFLGSRFGKTTLATNHFSGATNTSFASGRSFSGISTGSHAGFARVDGFRGDSIGGFRRGFGRGGRFRGGFGCFECGFGFGPFFDFDWGWPGFYGYDPIWYGSYSGFGYQYYPGSGYSGYSFAKSDPDYSSSNQNLDGGYSFSANNNLGVAAPSTMMNGYSSAINDNNNLPPVPQGSDDANPAVGNLAGSAPTALIYLKNGTTQSVTDYWLQAGRLYYTVNYGAPSTLKMKEVDLQRTVDENARRGIRFSLKPHPSNANSQPSRQNQGSTAPPTTPAPASARQPQTSSQSQT
jgi:hypothetical protein